MAHPVGCYREDTPALLGPPWVSETDPAVSITIVLREQLLGVDCVKGPDLEVTVQFTGPLGDRLLYGGGRVQYDQDEVPLYGTDSLGTVATERARAIAGPTACETRLNLGRAEPLPDQLAELTRGIVRGPADGGRAYVGSWIQAAEYFGAIERYSDYNVYVGIVATAANLHVADDVGDPGALIVSRLHNFELSGHREIWYPAFEFGKFAAGTVFRQPPCEVA